MRIIYCERFSTINYPIYYGAQHTLRAWLFVYVVFIPQQNIRLSKIQDKEMGERQIIKRTLKERHDKLWLFALCPYCSLESCIL
jgi:hypothetical protein